MGRPDFTQCSLDFHNDPALYDKWRYNGTFSQGAYSSLNSSQLNFTIVTVEGCRNVCGLGADLYTWAEASATISTWILPMIGLMLQAPYESNELISTLFFMARVVGSPIATMAYILWNIKVSAKCALMVDMSSQYDEYPSMISQFEQMRDSFYLLSVMNQYGIKQRMPRKEAEKLLRIALWSDSLQLEVVEDESRSLVKRRRKLARTIRESRKRGVVPVFISLMWFLFSLIVSIQAAFGQIGENATAHNLALGLLLAWLPSLILFSVVDRNPIAADAIRIKLNRLLDATRRALLDRSLRETYIRDIRRPERDFRWTERLENEDYFREDFFTRFSGQGRVRWHNGVAPSILAGIEMTDISRWSRGWLDRGDDARTTLVKGPNKLYELHWFDKNCLWQVAAAFAVVTASCGGAFIISYFTPTVGLGCRSGGYVTYFVLAVLSMIVEGITWAFVEEGSMADQDPLTRLSSNIGRRLSAMRSNEWKDTVRRFTDPLAQWWRHLTARDKIEVLILRPLDVANSLWLSYIVLSQVFGFYQTCDCQSSLWSSAGGFMDFETYDFYRSAGVIVYWGTGTALSILFLALAFGYAIVEWGQQSHISTLDYDAAHKGLRSTRRLRKSMETIHIGRHLLASLIERLVLRVWNMFRSRRFTTRTESRNGRKPMTWTSRAGPRSPPVPRIPRTPTIEMEGGNPMSRDASQGSQAYEMTTLPSVPSTSRLGHSHAESAPSRRYGHSPASSMGESWSPRVGAPMSRDASRSSQGIERKPLLSKTLTLQTSSSPSFSEQDWNSTMRRDVSNDSRHGPEEALVDSDLVLPATQRLHTREPRNSFGEEDMHPRSMPRSSPRPSAGEDHLELPEWIPRSQAY